MNVVSTSCRRCVFRTDHLGVQTGCKVGRIEKFGDRAVLQPEGHYTVEGRLCNMVRDADTVLGIPDDQLVETVRAQVTVRVGIVIDAAPGATADQIGFSLSALAEQDVKPVKVVVLLDGCGVTPAKAVGLLRTSGLAIPFEVFQLADWSESEEELYRSDRLAYAHDRAVHRFDEDAVTYVAFTRAGLGLAHHYICALDKAVNDDLRPISAVLGEKAYTVQTKLYNHPTVVGNRGVRITEKLRQMAEGGVSFEVVRYAGGELVGISGGTTP